MGTRRRNRATRKVTPPSRTRLPTRNQQSELPGELEQTWKDHDEEAKELGSGLSRDRDKPFWSQGPRLVERVGGLFRDVDGQFAAPTHAQRDYLAELRAEFEQRVADLDRFFALAVPRLNAVLETAGVPPVAVPGPVGDRGDD